MRSTQTMPFSYFLCGAAAAALRALTGGRLRGVCSICGPRAGTTRRTGALRAPRTASRTSPRRERRRFPPSAAHRPLTCASAAAALLLRRPLRRVSSAVRCAVADLRRRRGTKTSPAQTRSSATKGAAAHLLLLRSGLSARRRRASPLAHSFRPCRAVWSLLSSLISHLSSLFPVTLQLHRAFLSSLRARVDRPAAAPAQRLARGLLRGACAGGGGRATAALRA